MWCQEEAKNRVADASLAKTQSTFYWRRISWRSGAKVPAGLTVAENGKAMTLSMSYYGFLLHPPRSSRPFSWDPRGKRPGMGPSRCLPEPMFTRTARISPLMRKKSSKSTRTGISTSTSSSPGAMRSRLPHNLAVGLSRGVNPALWRQFCTSSGSPSYKQTHPRALIVASWRRHISPTHISPTTSWHR